MQLPQKSFIILVKAPLASMKDRSMPMRTIAHRPIFLSWDMVLGAREPLVEGQPKVRLCRLQSSKPSQLLKFTGRKPFLSQ